MSILQADAKYGEGFNHWLNVTVRATRSAQVRHWWAARGIIVSRLMRVRFGPVHLVARIAARSFARHAGERTQCADQRDRRRQGRRTRRSRSTDAAARRSQAPIVHGRFESYAAGLRFGGGQQLRQVLLPHRRPGVRAVAVRLIRTRAAARSGRS